MPRELDSRLDQDVLGFMHALQGGRWGGQGDFSDPISEWIRSRPQEETDEAFNKIKAYFLIHPEPKDYIPNPYGGSDQRRWFVFFLNEYTIPYDDQEFEFLIDRHLQRKEYELAGAILEIYFKKCESKPNFGRFLLETEDSFFQALKVDSFDTVYGYISWVNCLVDYEPDEITTRVDRLFRLNESSNSCQANWNFGIHKIVSILESYNQRTLEVIKPLALALSAKQYYNFNTKLLDLIEFRSSFHQGPNESMVRDKIRLFLKTLTSPN